MDISFDLDELEDMSYRELQRHAKNIGVRANQKVSRSASICELSMFNLINSFHTHQKTQLIDALRSHFEHVKR